jgi:hypothetical protein
MALTIDDVLRDLPKAPGLAKQADLTPVEAQSYGGLIQKLASVLRDLDAPEVTWESLYAVKLAGYRANAPRAALLRTDPDDDRPGAPLRKMAAAVRNFENQQATAFFYKNAAALKAVRGLTLLRERIAS